jgi:hypothetical protein
MTAEHTSYARNNLLTAIKSDGLTYKRFELMIVHVLGYRMDDMTLSLTKMSTGEQLVHRLSDSVGLQA